MYWNKSFLKFFNIHVMKMDGNLFFFFQGELRFLVLFYILVVALQWLLLKFLLLMWTIPALHVWLVLTLANIILFIITTITVTALLRKLCIAGEALVFRVLLWLLFGDELNCLCDTETHSTWLKNLHFFSFKREVATEC